MSTDTVSHFVPYMFWYEMEDHVPGPRVSGDQWRAVRRILESELNTSVTTARYDQSMIRPWEHEMRRHWDLHNGRIDVRALSDGARYRYDLVRRAWRNDLRDALYKVCPAQTAALDKFFNCLKYGKYA